MQTILKALGYKDAARNELTVDGKFGNATKFAVMAFQVSHGGSGDGIVGEWTWKKLIGG